MRTFDFTTTRDWTNQGLTHLLTSITHNLRQKVHVGGRPLADGEHGVCKLGDLCTTNVQGRVCAEVAQQLRMAAASNSRGQLRCSSIAFRQLPAHGIAEATHTGSMVYGTSCAQKLLRRWVEPHIALAGSCHRLAATMQRRGIDDDAGGLNRVKACAPQCYLTSHSTPIPT